ncbi:MAG TPA: chemotaxis protein CheC [Halanaerobiales bacterium]|nr:chemotaxis protein CheC [Halanaerobiales bacterium]
MNNSHINLNEIKKDALKEVGNIGAGNAATAFSEVLDRKIEIDVPSVEIIPLEDVSTITGSEEDHVAGVLFKVSGEAPGTILFVFPSSTIKYLIEVVMDKKIEPEEMGEIEISLLKELGNILSGSYLKSIGDMTNLNMNQSVPGFSYDMAGAILSSTMISASSTGENVLLIETEFMDGEEKIEGYFFFIPQVESLSIILKSLGLSGDE